MSARGENRLPVKSRLYMGQSWSPRAAFCCATTAAPRTAITAAVRSVGVLGIVSTACLKKRELLGRVGPARIWCTEHGAISLTKSGDARLGSMGYTPRITGAMTGHKGRGRYGKTGAN